MGLFCILLYVCFFCCRGEEKDNNGAFRETFSKLGEVRSICLGVPILALTATASPTQRRSIMKSLCFRPTYITVLDTPDRPNIKITSKAISNTDTLKTTFNWLIEQLKLKQCERCVIFCTTIKECSSIYMMFAKIFGKFNKMVDMYHSKTTDAVKNRIRADMAKEEGELKVLICTNAAGMGVNFNGLHNIIHYGPPHEMDTFVQQMGRAGRDGLPSHELILYKHHKGHLKKVEPELVHLMTNKDICRRKVLTDSYVSTSTQSVILHNCCDICASRCNCNLHVCPNTHPFVTFNSKSEDDEAIVHDDEMKRSVTNEELQLLKFKLNTYQYYIMENEPKIVGSDILYGFDDNSIRQIIECAEYIFTAEDVMERCSIWSYKICVSVTEMFNSVFGDEDLYACDDSSSDSD